MFVLSVNEGIYSAFCDTDSPSMTTDIGSQENDLSALFTVIGECVKM